MNYPRGYGISRRSIVNAGLSLPLLGMAGAFAEAPLATAPSTEPTKPHQQSMSQQLEHTAVLLRTEDANRLQYSGTGFFFNFFSVNQTSLTAIVTNRHVVNGMKKFSMRWTRKKESGEPDFGKFIDVTIDDPEKRVILHPDPNVDLAIIAVSDILVDYGNRGQPAFAIGLDQKLIASEPDLQKFQPLEDVLIVGYPDGISDTVNNIPIFRRGVTATPIYMRFDGKKQFMIDAAIYHGSSGSPVFLYNVGAWIDENGQTQLGTRVGLLGVVYGVIESTTPGEIRVLPAPTQMQAKAYSQIPHNLGACVSAYCILDFEPEIVKMGFKPPEGYKMRAQP
jgi:hypothetical protein